MLKDDAREFESKVAKVVDLGKDGNQRRIGDLCGWSG
jgi:hypothetical protein